MQETAYRKPVDPPYTRLRFYLATSSGDVEKFTIQLEYDLLAAGRRSVWQALARFDHNPYSRKGHDIRDEGLHLDIIDADNSKQDVKRGFPSVDVQYAPEYCENYLLKHHDPLVADFERRNGINGKFYPP